MAQLPQQQPETTRRDLFKVAGAALATQLVGISSAAETKGPLFFTPDEFAMVDELSEIIIPTDEHSPGARAAQVAAYIDARLAESFESEPKDEWKNGLKLVDALSQKLHGVRFLKATEKQRILVVGNMAENELFAKTPEELFFKELKGETAHAYYTSKIGIHTEMEYKGNSILQEFAGYDLDHPEKSTD